MNSTERIPIYINSDWMEFDQTKSTITYKGRVVTTQGEMTLRSETLTAEYTENMKQIKQIVAEGKVNVTQGNRVATGEKAVFDDQAKTVTLTGNPIMRQGNSQISGSRVIYFVEQDKAVAEGDGKVRVQATIFPEELQAKDKGETASEQLAMSVLTAEAVAKTYNGRRVVNGVNIEVRGGEIVGLLGPNGAGKTTTFHIMVGLVQPDEGKVLLNDQNLTGAPIYQRARAGISYLPQESSVFRRLTVEENLFAILQTLDLSGVQQQERCEALMKMLGVDHLADHKAFTLSGGERRRVEIARALVLSPYFVLLDEPFTGVDPIAVAEIQKIIRGLIVSGIGILITDHNVRETLGICDRAYILSEGTVLEEGTPDKIASSAKARKFYLGEGFKF